MRMSRKAKVQPNHYPPPGPIGNTQGLIVHQTEANTAGGNIAPPIKPTPKEKGWWDRWGSEALHVGLDVVGLIPGVGESLRVNGRAEISLDPELLELGRVQGKLPRSVLRIQVQSCYFQCAKAALRSGLWDAARQVERGSLPSAGDIFRCIDETFDVAAYERDLQQRQRTSLY